MTTILAGNETRVINAMQVLAASGIDEFCVCPASRNSPLVSFLEQQTTMRLHYWFEERSAAFFALGRSKLLQKPVAVVTTSGTSAGELLPAVMEAYYAGIPLLCITADRPRRFRGTGSPQTAEQVGLFGVYAHYECDLEDGYFSLSEWQQTGPAHLNICFEEPSREAISYPILTVQPFEKKLIPPAFGDSLDRFLEKSSYPFVVVSSLKEQDREAVTQFLLQLKAPVFLEGISGLREDGRLRHLQIDSTGNSLHEAKDADYPIDSVLRIGGVPTFRLWRDLEDLEGSIDVFSVTDTPFPGLSWGQMLHTPVGAFFEKYALRKIYRDATYWIENDHKRTDALFCLFSQEPRAEASLVHQLSCKLSEEARIYLGNSLPIREWDQAACRKQHPYVCASRGLNGIDGQISTFLGLCEAGKENWALMGDLTALYDLAGFWILPQMQDTTVTIVVINNGGGKIFDTMYPSPVFQNQHSLSFKCVAELWGLAYERWTEIPDFEIASCNRLIELVPDDEATKRFLKKLKAL